MRNHSYENEFDLHENETAGGTHFHEKGFALILVLKQRHKRNGLFSFILISSITCKPHTRTADLFLFF